MKLNLVYLTNTYENNFILLSDTSYNFLVNKKYNGNQEIKNGFKKFLSEDDEEFYFLTEEEQEELIEETIENFLKKHNGEEISSKSSFFAPIIDETEAVFVNIKAYSNFISKHQITIENLYEGFIL